MVTHFFEPWLFIYSRFEYQNLFQNSLLNLYSTFHPDSHKLNPLQQQKRLFFVVGKVSGTTKPIISKARELEGAEGAEVACCFGASESKGCHRI